MSEKIRQSGIDILGDVPWGTHFCQFYQTPDDLIDILVPYFKAGLENNEFCMWVTSKPLMGEDAKAALHNVVKNVDDYIVNGQIEILDYDQWYTKSGKFEADEILHAWVEKKNQALKKGFDGLRLTGNTFWLEQEDWKDFRDYEAAVDNVIGKYRILALCSYSLDKCGVPEVIDVVANHRFALIRQSGKWELIQSANRQRAEEALLKSREKYRDLFECNKDGIVRTDMEGKILEANGAFLDMLGYTRDEIGKITYRQLTPERWHKMEAEIVENQFIQKGYCDEFEKEYIKKDGRLFPASFKGWLIKDEYGQPFGMWGFVRDITRQKLTEKALRKARNEMGKRVERRTEELRHLSTRLLQAHEEESKRIGQELHDGLGQMLSAIKVWGEAAGAQVGQERGVEALNSLEHVVSLAQGAVEEVRRISQHLRPSVLDDLGLLAAISWLCKDFQATHSGIGIEQQIDIQENDVPESLKIIIFRISQESLNNIGKHSQANLVHFSLKRVDGNKIELTVTDNGTGFDLDHVRSGVRFGRGFGLTNMKERAELSGGTFAIQSTQGAGTILKASWQC
jgi:PAS domain S-box-containing protein